MAADWRIGYGEDAHRLIVGRPLLIGGVEIPGSPHGPEAVSDGDALLHALADALLSGFAQGDIGDLYPPDDPGSANLDSALLLQAVFEQIRSVHGTFTVHNIAATVILDRPELSPYREAIQERVATLVALEGSRLGITFKTSEGLAPGYIQVRATVLMSLES